MYEVTIYGEETKTKIVKTKEAARRKALAYIRKGCSASIREFMPSVPNIPADLY